MKFNNRPGKYISDNDGVDKWTWSAWVCDRDGGLCETWCPRDDENFWKWLELIESDDAT